MDRTGYLLIADITGYTTYLSRSELDHAEQTLSSLLELLVSETPPPLTVSQLEGDAVMSYSLAAEMPSGQTFIESIEAVYIEFRRALELMVLNTSCNCNACANISNLDLKFFVHHGMFMLQPIHDREQLVGSDVNLIHRLLKNSVTEETGVNAYLLVTDPARTALGIDESSNWLRSHVETVADFGEQRTWVRDMRPAFAASKDVPRSSTVRETSWPGSRPRSRHRDRWFGTTSETPLPATPSSAQMGTRSTEWRAVGWARGPSTSAFTATRWFPRWWWSGRHRRGWSSRS